jgi:succinate dehydrogenase / fumarate reductase flavoprotein subunit
MYHQFMELAGVDITAEPMEVGPTTHYMVGGVRVDAESQMSTVAGLYAAGECAAGLHGANRLGGNSLSDLLVFGKRAGDAAARFAREQGKARTIAPAQVEAASRAALAPFDRPASSDGNNPYQVQHTLQEMMQDLVGIVRTKQEMERALEGLAALRAREARVAATGNRDYNPGWHTALDLASLLVVSEAVTRSALARTESRGAHFRDDHPQKDEALGKVRHVVKLGPDGAMRLERIAVTPPAPELQRIIEEQR